MRQITFYKASEEYGYLSNLYKCKIDFRGTTWDSTEIAYQFYKFKDASIGAWVIQAPKQSILAHLAHLFNDPKYKEEYVREDWDTYKISLMKKVLYCKFSQHEDLKKKLLITKKNY